MFAKVLLKMFLIGRKDSNLLTSSVFAKRIGLFGAKREQQSWSGSIDALKVPIVFERAIISDLLYPIRGRNIGCSIPALIAEMFCMV